MSVKKMGRSRPFYFMERKTSTKTKKGIHAISVILESLLQIKLSDLSLTRKTTLKRAEVKSRKFITLFIEEKEAESHRGNNMSPREKDQKKKKTTDAMSWSALKYSSSLCYQLRQKREQNVSLRKKRKKNDKRIVI